MKTENKYVVWSFIPGTIQPAGFRYNQTKEDGEKLASEMNEKYHNGREKYFCDEQGYDKYGGSTTGRRLYQYYAT